MRRRSAPGRALPLVLGPVLALVLGLAACTGDDSPAGPDPDAAASSAAPSPMPLATPVAAPAVGTCYRLGLEEALAPTDSSSDVDCGSRHTSTTIAVGTLENLRAGHLLAVDSRQVREAVAAQCPRQFAEAVGGTEADRRLSMLRPVWFTPTLEESAAGAQWYRCDAIAVSGSERLAPLSGRLRGVLDRPEGRERFAMCGTDSPDAAGFERVVCSERHTWRAIEVVTFEESRYPGERAARERGQTTCEDAGARVADDPLDYAWVYEWPTAEQWRAGQTYGRCWAPV